MEVKILILFSLFFGSAPAQNIHCNYRDWYFDGIWHYTCDLSIQNPWGFDNFTTIDGTHLPGRTDADVVLINRQYPSISTVFPKILCTQFENLNEIDFMSHGLERIFENSFSSCVNLERLLLDWNLIEDVHERAFVHNTKLSLLVLSQNMITDFSENTFDSLVNLKELVISSNPLKNIPDGLFKGLINLEFLSMDKVNIHELNPAWFENFLNLRMLSIAWNNFTAFPEDVLSQIKNLWGLDIGRNPIGNNLSSGSFRALTNLQILYMNQIEMNQIDPALFESLSNLKELYMYRNSITSIPEGIFDNLTNLTHLDISGNGLNESGIPGNLFDNLSQLLNLYINSNPIQNLNPQWFQNLKKLTNLYLGYNQIRELPIGIFAPFENLSRIFLSYSNLKIISRSAFGNVSSLKYADFSGNIINAIDERFLREAYPLIELFLANNLCVSRYFYLFGNSREYYMQFLEECTTNFKSVVGK